MLSKRHTLRRSRFVGCHNLHYSVLFMLWFILTLSACNPFLKDKKQNQKPFELDMQGLQCMNQIPEILHGYFTQKIEISELHQSTICIDKTLSQFLSSTRGSDLSGYDRKEVQKFFQKYIFKRDVSDSLAKEIMKLKVAMVGGREESISRAEFEKLRGLLSIMETEMIRLYPHLGVFFFREPMVLAHLGEKNRFEEAIKALKVSVQNILDELHLADSEYSLPEVDLLLGEIEVFADIKDPQHPFSQWRRNLPTLENLKTLLVGEVAEVRGRKEIHEIWDMLVDVYKLGLQYQGRIRTLDWMQRQNFAEMDRWIEDLFTVLNRGFALRNKGQIPFKRIDEIMDEFYQRDLWLEPLKPTTAKITYRQFVARFLESSNSELLAVDVKHLIKLHREYQAYKLIQNVLGKVFDSKARRPSTEVLVVLENYKITPDIRALSPLSVRDQEYFSETWSEFLQLIKSPFVRHWDQQGRISIGQSFGHQGLFGPSKWEYWNYEELSYLNLLRVPASMIMQAYANNSNKAPKDNFLTTDRIKVLYDEFQDFGDEMGLFDLRNTDSSGRTSFESNLFTPSGNGDGKVQFSELFDLFTSMLSGGLNGVSDFKKMAESSGCLLDIQDYFHKPYIEMTCASRTLRTHFAQLFPQMPQVSKFVKQLTNDQWDSFWKDLLVVSRVCPEDQIGLETGDQRTMLVIIHYIENLFSIYDSDRSGDFDENEVSKAFPRFSEFMVEVTKRRVQKASPTTFGALETIGFDWSGIALDVFKYIVFNGRSPSGDELLAFIAGDMVGLRGDLGHADRQAIVRVFATLKAEISSGPVICKSPRE